MTCCQGKSEPGLKPDQIKCLAARVNSCPDTNQLRMIVSPQALKSCPLQKLPRCSLPLRSSTTAGGGCATFLFQEFLFSHLHKDGLRRRVPRLIKSSITLSCSSISGRSFLIFGSTGESCFWGSSVFCSQMEYRFSLRR